MAPSMFDSTTLPVLEQVVGFAQARHGVLAGNIANLDTPGYKTRDLSVDQFQDNLRRAIDASRRPVSPGHSLADGEGPAISSFDDVRDSLQDILFHDGSDVSLEKQIAELSKNQAMHNLAINLMSAQFRLLRAAISERAV